jgi:hypothetical protein
MDDSKYVKKIYNMMLNDKQNKPGKIFKKMFESLSFYHAWLMHGVSY